MSNGRLRSCNQLLTQKQDHTTAPFSQVTIERSHYIVIDIAQ
ncbi:hypothetical protein [Dulcicalothrix desertica]|nr:hypothetical protein [Dulcicalothrix desertica]